MATHFAEQRPCKGMSGFKFRTRTKSKYDRPKPLTFIDQMTKQLDAKNKRGRSTNVTKTKNSKNKVINEQQVGIKQLQSQITTEDLKKFFTQLSDATRELNRTTNHRSPLNESLDFKKDVAKAKQAALNHQLTLEQVAQMRIRMLVDDAYSSEGGEIKKNVEVKQPTVPELPISTQISAMGESIQPLVFSKHGSGVVKSLDSRRTIKSGKAVIESNKHLLTKSTNFAAQHTGIPYHPISMTKSTSQNRESHQKLRLSAEGLLDIVTEQYLDGGLGKSTSNGTKGNEKKIHRQQSEAKGMTILTPILTENSDNNDATKNANIAHSSSPEAAEQMLKLASSDVANTQFMAQSQTKRTGQTTEGEAIPRNLLSPDLQHMLSKKSSRNMPATGDHSQNTPTSKMSCRSVQSVKRAVFSKRTSMSQDNLAISMTPRVTEPRRDNEDLRMISEIQRDTEGNEFGSKAVQRGQESDEVRLRDAGGKTIDLKNIGAIEMKLTHHSPNSAYSFGASRFKRRLKSAGPRRFQNTTNQANSLVPSGISAGRYTGNIRPNASGGHIPLAQLASNESLVKFEVEQKATEAEQKQRQIRTKEIGTDESWVQNLDLNLNVEGIVTKSTRMPKQVNTLMLSDKSKQSQVLLQSSPPSVGQLYQASTLQLLSKTGNVTMQTGSEVLVQDTSDRHRLQHLIDAEIDKLKQSLSGERGGTPQLAFVDQSQLFQRGFSKSPQRSLKFLEDTMKQHFKYGVTAEVQNSIARPILSTRQNYQSVLQQQLQEEKVLQTLKSNNEQDKYAEFKNAQQVAAAMMDIVKSSQPGGEVILETKDGASLSLTREQLLPDYSQQAKTGEHTLQFDLQGNTLENNFNISQTGKSSGKCPSRLQRQTSPMFTQYKKHMRIEVKPAIIAPQVPEQNYQSEMDSTYPHRTQIVPAKLDIELQENVSNNIASYNHRIVQNRVKMAVRRNSRPDTLNQLVSPRDHFEKTHRAYQKNDPLDLSQKKIDQLKQQAHSPQPQVQLANHGASPNADLPTCNSVNSYDRKINMHAQGGGFNRSPCSGYFKGARKSSILQQQQLLESQQYELLESPQQPTVTHIQTQLSKSPSEQLEKKPKKLSKTIEPPKKPVVVEERPQILANEVWASQNRCMPYKVVFQMQKAPPAKRPMTHRNQMQQRRSISPRGAHGDFLKGAQAIAPMIQRGEAKFEVFPFQEQTEAVQYKEGTTQRNTGVLNTPPRESNMQVLSKGTLAGSGSLLAHKHPNQANTATGEMLEGPPPFLAAINEQFSDGQQTTSNPAIVGFRYSKGQQSQSNVFPDSTIHLRGSYTPMDGFNDLQGSKANLVYLDEGGAALQQNNHESHKRISDNGVRLSHELDNHRKFRMLNSHDGSIPFPMKDLPATELNMLQEDQKQGDGESKQIEVEDIMSSIEQQRMNQVKTANLSSYDPDELQPKAEAIATATAYSNQPDATVVRISDLANKAQPQQPVYDTLGQQVFISTPSCEAATDNFGPRRRSVLQKATVRTHQQNQQTKQQPEYRVQLTPTACSQVLVKDDRDLVMVEEENRPLSNEAPDSDTIDDQTPKPIFEDQQTLNAMDHTQQTQQTHRAMLTQDHTHPSQEFTVVENILNTERSTSINHHLTTKAMWQPSVTANAERGVVGNSHAQRPKTTNPSQVQRVADPQRRFIQNSASQQPRQTVVYRNVSINSSNQSFGIKGERGSSYVKSSQKNRSNNDIQHLVQNQRSQNKSPARTQLEGTRRNEPKQAKKEKCTFTQGVSQLIRNFDKKFIVQSVALPSPAPLSSIDLVRTQQKQIVNRNVSLNRHKSSVAAQTSSRDNFITANITNQHLKTVSSIKESVTRTLTVDETARGQPPKPPSSTTAAVRSKGLLNQRVDLQRSKSRPSYATGGGSVPRSPIVQKAFDADNGLNQVQPTFLSSSQNPSRPTFHGMTADSQSSPAQYSTKNKQNTTLGERASLNSQTTIATLHHNNARRFGQQASPALSRGTHQQQFQQPQHQSRMHGRVDSLKHPLEFLAHQAVVGTQDVMSSRNDGLIVHDRRKYQDEMEHALSDSACNLVDNINCSLIQPQTGASKIATKPPIGARRRTIRHQHEGTFGMGQLPMQDKRASLPELLGQQTHNESGVTVQQHNDYHLESTINAQSTTAMPFEQETGYASMAGSTNSFVSGNNGEHNNPWRSQNHPNSRPTTLRPQYLKQSASMSIANYSGGPAVQRSTLQRFHQNAQQNQMPPHVLEKYSRHIQARVKSGSGSVVGSNRLSLTQNDIQSMFKGLQQVQQKQLNLSTVVLHGTQVNQHKISNQTPTNRISNTFISSGAKQSKQHISKSFKRRAMSSNLNGAKSAPGRFKAGDTLPHRDSLLFKQTVIEGSSVV